MTKVFYHSSGIYRVIFSVEEGQYFISQGWTENPEPGKKYVPYTALTPASAGLSAIAVPNEPPAPAKRGPGRPPKPAQDTPTVGITITDDDDDEDKK